MRSNTSIYSCFSERGEDTLPTNDFIYSCYKDNIEPIIFLDSCVCLQIIKVVDYGRAAKNVDINKVLALKEYLEIHPDIRLNPFFALLELCNLKGVFDKDKLFDFKLRIDFFEQIPLKTLKKFKYNFHRDIFVFRHLSDIPENPLDHLHPILMNSYCTILKIRSIALKGLTNNMAEKNLNELEDWMINDLNIFRGAEYKLAMNIFGGNTLYRKMIALDVKKPLEIKRTVLGTSWDMFHAKFTANSHRLNQILERNIYPFFLTSDSYLFKLFKDLTLTVVKDGGEDFMSSFISLSHSNYPHFDEEFIERNNKKLINVFVERNHQEYLFDRQKSDKLIHDLEMINNIVV